MAGSKSQEEYFLASLEFFRKSKKACLEEAEQRSREHKEQMNKTTNLRAVYLYGLGQVLNLQDLRHSPHSILPGNFPKATKF